MVTYHRCCFLIPNKWTHANNIPIEAIVDGLFLAIMFPTANKKPNQQNTWWKNSRFNHQRSCPVFLAFHSITYMLHVYICLHLAGNYGTSRKIYHTWILWVMLLNCIIGIVSSVNMPTCQFPSPSDDPRTVRFFLATMEDIWRYILNKRCLHLVDPWYILRNNNI